MFLKTPAAPASYIKHDFSVCVEKLLAASVHTAEGEKNKVILETIYLHYLFICIMNAGKNKQKKNGVYTGDTELGIGLVDSFWISAMSRALLWV